MEKKSAMTRTLEIFRGRAWRRDSFFMESVMEILLKEVAFYPSPEKRAEEVMALISCASAVSAEQVADMVEALLILNYGNAHLFRDIMIVRDAKLGPNNIFVVFEGLICGLVRAAVWTNGNPGNEAFDEALPKLLAELICQFARAVLIRCKAGQEPPQKLGGDFANGIAAYLSAKGWPTESGVEALRRCRIVMDHLSVQDWDDVRGAPQEIVSDVMHKALASVPSNHKLHALRGFFHGQHGSFDARNLLRCYAVVEGVHLERLDEEMPEVSLCFASVEAAEAFVEYCRLAHYVGKSGDNVKGVARRFGQLKIRRYTTVPKRDGFVETISELEMEDIARLRSWLLDLAKIWSAELSKLPVPEFGSLHGAITFEWDKPVSLKLPEEAK